MVHASLECGVVGLSCQYRVHNCRRTWMTTPGAIALATERQSNQILNLHDAFLQSTTNSLSACNYLRYGAK